MADILTGSGTIPRMPGSDTVVITVGHRERKIGDSLCAVPAILRLAQLSGRAVTLRGAFCPAVMPLLRDHPIRLDRGPTGGSPDGYRLDIQAVYDRAGRMNEHMATGFCRSLGLPAPALPVDPGLAADDIGLPPGVVISPFSGSANGWYKVWPVSRWLDLTQRIAARYPAAPIYVVGAATDDVTPFLTGGLMPLIDFTLPEVLALIRAARVFVSIDNGLSHLAHFGRVSRHVLLYPALLAPALVANPRAHTIRATPQAITVDSVFAAFEDAWHRSENDARSPA
ncbi:MAG TPA: hypothetical protein VFN46_10410 [Acetobacteraceae bacterium]|nr:hypothetical protein [Acetobacteraceae bacterium]